MKEIIDVQSLSDNICTKQNREWSFGFVLTTNHRSYELQAYSLEDRNVWLKAFTRLITVFKILFVSAVYVN